MSAIDTLRQALYGNPPSESFKPERDGVIAAFSDLQRAIGSIGLSGVVSVVKTTKALLDADLAHAAGVIALVYDDATEANNDLHAKSGDSGAGAWTNTGALHSLMEALTGPVIEEASNYADLAEDAAKASVVGTGNTGNTDDVALGSSEWDATAADNNAWSNGLPLTQDGPLSVVELRVTANMTATLYLVDLATRAVMAKATGKQFATGVSSVEYPFGVFSAPAGTTVFVERETGGNLYYEATTSDILTVAAGDYDVGDVLPAYATALGYGISIKTIQVFTPNVLAPRVSNIEAAGVIEFATLPRGIYTERREPAFMASPVGTQSGGMAGTKFSGDAVLRGVQIHVSGTTVGVFEHWREIGGVPTLLQRKAVALPAGWTIAEVPGWALRGTSYVMFNRVWGSDASYGNGGTYTNIAIATRSIGATASVSLVAGYSVCIGLHVDAPAGDTAASIAVTRSTLDRQSFEGETAPSSWSVASPFSVNDGLIASGSGGWDKFAGFGKASSLHKRKLTGRVTITSTASIFGLATKTVGGPTVGGAVAMIDGTAGKLRIYEWTGDATAGTLATEANFAAALVANRDYTLVVNINSYNIEAVLTDCVTGTQTTVSEAMGPDGNTARFHGRPGFMHISGSWRADWSHFEIDAPRAQPSLFFGDSNTEGVASSLVGASWAQQIITAAGAGLISARSGEASTDMVRRLNDLTALRPAVAICAHGTNEDISISTENALLTWRSNVGAFVDACRGVNAEPILVRPLPQPAKQALMTAIDADISANYFGKLRSIDFLGACSNGGDRLTWNAAYQTGDNLHANAAGQTRMMQQALIDVPELEA